MAQFVIDRASGTLAVTNDSFTFEAGGASAEQRFLLLHNPTRAKIYGTMTFPAGHVPSFEGIDDGDGFIRASGQVVTFALNPDSSATIISSVAINATAGNLSAVSVETGHGTLAPLQLPDTNQILLARYH